MGSLEAGAVALLCLVASEPGVTNRIVATSLKVDIVQESGGCYGLCVYNYTSWFWYFSNGLCPRLHISYMRQPKLHTSLAVEYFL